MGDPTTLRPRPEDLIARARALVPELRSRAQACEDRRSVPPETVADFRAAFRDLHAMSVHTALQFDAASERFGRIELGLPPGSPLALL